MRHDRSQADPETTFYIPVALKVQMNEIARQFRNDSTPSEVTLWQALRGRKLSGRRFRRQQPIGPFVVDFYCAAEHLAVEIDGPIHEQLRDVDVQRQALIEATGVRFVRLSASQVQNDLSGSLDIIRACFGR